MNWKTGIIGNMRRFFNPRIWHTIASAVFILVGTLIAIQYAKGNIRMTRDGFVRNAGLLAANSFPTGAEVIIDGKLVTATDDTLYLEPGQYEVELVKDGYVPWKKLMTIEQELVTQTNARLFPSAASFSPLTFTGVTNISPSPDGQKIIYYSNTAKSDRKNGLYLLELSTSALPIQRGPRQITSDLPSFQLADARFIWAPDSSEVILITPTREVLLVIDRLNDLAALPDISFRKRQILTEWEEEMYVRERQFLTQFPLEIVAIATQSAKNVYLSPDKKRLLYTATTSATIPDTIVPPLPSTNRHPEERSLTAGGIYVYDRKEDKNFRVGTEKLSDVRDEALQSRFGEKQLLVKDVFMDAAQLRTATSGAFTSLQATISAQTAASFTTYHSPLYANTFQWFPDSKHLLFAEGNNIKVMGYDSTNVTTIYSGPFSENFLYPWPDGNRLLIIASFSPDVPHNLYAIELK
jgi:hypothetical protein